jgi:hypothetical protein
MRGDEGRVGGMKDFVSIIIKTQRVQLSCGVYYPPQTLTTRRKYHGLGPSREQTRTGLWMHRTLPATHRGHRRQFPQL